MLREPVMLCRHCSYDIRLLPLPRCPECGRPFDPANPRSFLHKHPWPRLKRWALRAAILLVLLTATLSGAAWWLIDDYEKDFLARGCIRIRLPADLVLEPIGPAWIRNAAGPDNAHYFQRVIGLRMRCTRITPRQVEAIAQMHHLRTLSLTGIGVTDSDVERFANLTELTDLSLRYNRLTDRAVPYIAQLKKLKTLDLSAETITQAGLAHLANHPNLENLTLRPSAALTDTSIDIFRSLPKLRQLNLSRCNSTFNDQSLARFAALSNLRVLILDLDYENDRSPVTPQAIADFRSRRPEVKLLLR